MTEVFAQIEAMIISRMREYKITGAAAAVVDGQKTIWAKGFGFADLRQKIPASKDTIFKIGSITKVFTAMAIMQQEEAGLIDLDASLAQYLPDFSIKTRFADATPIKIRDILCHHAGLPCDNYKDFFSSDPSAFRSVLPFLREAYAAYPPGYMFAYSNLGYALLGVLIERLSGMAFHDYIKERILNPCGMAMSGIIPADSLDATKAKPYARHREETEPLMREIPPGGILSTASDMAIFLQVLNGGAAAIFKKRDTLTRMRQIQHPHNILDLNTNTGLGWFVGRAGLEHAGQVAWHDGGTPHYFSLLIHLPEQGLGIILLSNSSGGALLNHRTAPEALNLLLAAKGIHPAPDDGRDTIIPAPAIADRVSGRYATLSGLVSITGDNGKLTLEMPSGRFRLQPCRDGWFIPKFLLFGRIPVHLKQLSLLRFGVIGTGADRFLALEQMGLRSAQGRPYDPPAIPEIWRRRCGRYACINDRQPRIKDFRLTCNKDGLFLKTAADKIGRLQVVLRPISETECLIEGLGRYAGETLAVQKTGDREDIRLMGLLFGKGPARANVCL